MSCLAGAIASVVFVLATLVPAHGAGAGSSHLCGRREVARLVKEFVSAYNAGDLERLDGTFSQEPDFLGYYVVPERHHDKGEDRSTLVPYFERRHELGDRFRLETYWSEAERESDGSISFFVKVVRTSDERRAEGIYSGKGNAAASLVIPDVSDPTDSYRCFLRLWNLGEPRRQG
jgi:ketosteroid isomerase-like protein